MLTIIFATLQLAWSCAKFVLKFVVVSCIVGYIHVAYRMQCGYLLLRLVLRLVLRVNLAYFLHQPTTENVCPVCFTWYYLIPYLIP